MKFFWRLKKPDALEAPGATGDTSPADAAPAVPRRADAPAEDAATAAPAGPTASNYNEPAVASAMEATASNVVTLQPARLTERIAAAALKTVTALATAEPVTLVTDTLKARAPGPLPGQEAAYRHLARALGGANAQGHVLVVGRAGTGRHTAVNEVLRQARAGLGRPCDWIYVAADNGHRLEAFSLPHGQGALFTREAKAAISRAIASYHRLVASDDFKLAFEIIDEEFRQRAAKTIDLLKRRAEDQNVALMKTPEGFVLAPMHEGKVVRNDVFRSLPEAMQRDVEAKIGELEAELKVYLDRLPVEDQAQAERLAACQRETAVRAVRPQIEALRRAFAACASALDALQGALELALAAQSVTPGAALGAVGVDVLNLQTAADFAESAPVVVLHDVSAASLCGEVRRDGEGRPVVTSGALHRANGGFLVLDAWRLAAETSAWPALASVLESGVIRPRGGDGPGVDVVPYAGRVVLVADEHAITRLLAIDAGLRRYFPHVVRFASTLPRSEMGVAEYAAFAAGLAASHGLRPIAATASDALYRAALARDGDASSVPLDAHVLRALLMAADVEAGAEDAPHIRACHVEEALRRTQDAVV